MTARRRHDVTMPRESLQFERAKLLKRQGFFVTRCVCLVLVLITLATLFLVAVLGHFYMESQYAGKNAKKLSLNHVFGNEDDLDPIHLPHQIVPEYYRLRIIPHLKNNTFNGHVQITLSTHSDRIAKIILHAEGLNVGKINLTKQIAMKRLVQNPEEISLHSNATEENIQNGGLQNSTTTSVGIVSKARSIIGDFFFQRNKVKKTTVKSHHSDEKAGRLILNLEGGIEADSIYVLDIYYDGKFSNSTEGIYLRKYEDSDKITRSILATNFAPIYSRKAFPCFDQPDYKAAFEISLLHHENFSAVSNTPVASVEDVEDQPTFKWSHFTKTPRISPSMVSFLITNLTSTNISYQSSDGSNKSISVYTTKQTKELMRFALKTAPKLLKYYEELFSFAYPLEKLDFVAMPSMDYSSSSGWGLVLIDQSNIFYNDTLQEFAMKLKVSLNLAESLVSQWFGGVVSIQWWNDLWLFEGLISYFKYLGVDKIMPESNAIAQLNTIKNNAMNKDLLVTRTALAQPLTNEKQVFHKFDEISYGKSASLLRMLNHTLGEEAFVGAVRTFIEKWKYNSAEEEDLWSAMIENSPTNAAHKKPGFTLMKSWTSQPGFPIVTVSINRDSGVVNLSQQPYTTNGVENQEPNRLWTIPISMRSTNKGNANETKVWMDDRKMSLKLNISGNELVYLDSELFGYYYVNYDPIGWKLLSNATTKYSAVITADAISAARMGLIPYGQAFSLLAEVSKTEDYPDNLLNLVNEIDFLDDILVGSGYYSYFQEFLYDLIKKGLKESRFRTMAAKDAKDAIFIQHMVDWECRSEADRCLNWSKKLFKEWMENRESNRIPIIHRSTIYETAVKFGGRKELTFLWKSYVNETDRRHKKTILNSFGHVTDYSLAIRLINTVIDFLPSEDCMQVWKGKWSATFKQAAQTYLIEHWDLIRYKFEKKSDLIRIIDITFDNIGSQREYDTFMNFVHEKQATFPPMATIIKRINESGLSNLKWRQKHVTEIGLWLKQHYHEHDIFL